MSISPSIPATVEIKRGRFISLVAAVVVATAAVTWILVAYAFDTGNSPATSSSAQAHAIYNPLPPASLQARVVAGPDSTQSAAADARKVPSIMSLTPEGLAEGALGTGYALPAAKSGPTLASVLASMSPQTRQYTEAIMRLTFAQLAAGAAGHP